MCKSILPTESLAVALKFSLTINSHVPETQKQNISRLDQEPVFPLAVQSNCLHTHLPGG
jgi:hypothetical protein